MVCRSLFGRRRRTFVTGDAFLMDLSHLPSFGWDSLLAIYGAVVSTVMTLREVMKEQQKIRVTGSPGIFEAGFCLAGVRKTLVRQPPASEQNRIGKLLLVQHRQIRMTIDNLSKLHSLQLALMHDLLTGRKCVTALLDVTEESN